jgi:hypothetical protein
MLVFNHKFSQSIFCDWECRTLILGTFNPENGPFADYYYGRVNSHNGWSNRFWPAISEYLVNEHKLNVHLQPGDLEGKLRVMRQLKFSCLDVILRIESPNDEVDINGNGFADMALMRKNNQITYNTENIIAFIKEREVKNVIASWGKGSSLSKPFKAQLDVLRKECPDVHFELYNLPPFGRPLVNNYSFGKMIYDQLLK